MKLEYLKNEAHFFSAFPPLVSIILNLKHHQGYYTSSLSMGNKMTFFFQFIFNIYIGMLGEN